MSHRWPDAATGWPVACPGPGRSAHRPGPPPVPANLRDNPPGRKSAPVRHPPPRCGRGRGDAVYVTVAGTTAPRSGRHTGRHKTRGRSRGCWAASTARDHPGHNALAARPPRSGIVRATGQKSGFRRSLRRPAENAGQHAEGSAGRWLPARRSSVRKKTCAIHAMATMTLRSPVKGLRPCATSRLSSIRISPGCQGKLMAVSR